MTRIPEESWFHRAKLGIFLHWGIYSVKGVPESWAMYYHGQDVPWPTLSREDYFAQYDGFTAARYDPAAWAALFKEAGARYAVLTTKHHDGVAMWDTALSDDSIVKKSPVGRDVIAPYCEAMRDAGLHVGLYFSHADWSHPDFPSLHAPRRDNALFTSPMNVRPDDQMEDRAGWARFLAFRNGQVRELMERFHPELLWFDGDFPHGPAVFEMRELRDEIKARDPQVIVNSRLGAWGDYETPEQALPVRPPEETWELCTTVNRSWDYAPQDNDYKPIERIVRIFTECVGHGGNLLLGVGPDAEGRFDPRAVEILKGLGAWIRPNAEAIYDTRRGLPDGLFNGASTLSADKRTLYLIAYDRAANYLLVKGLASKPARVTRLDTGAELSTRGDLGVLWIDLTAAGTLNPNATVFKLEFEEPLCLK
ncbi:MAG: alpha-L-fucosidase [Clostridiales bacterium]|nr:alpha-L-fucosidase [Clostridiales bacterium]